MGRENLVSVRYMVDDVDQAVDFYTRNFGFKLGQDASPAFADVVRGDLRLLLAGPESSAGRPMPDGRKPEPGGWNRIHFVVDDIESEVERLRSAGLIFRNDIISGPGGQQILVDDPSGNPIELFQPADNRAHRVTWDLGDQEFESVRALSAQKRYEYFIKRAASHGELYGLRDETGWDGRGQRNRSSPRCLAACSVRAGLRRRALGQVATRRH